MQNYNHKNYYDYDIICIERMMLIMQPIIDVTNRHIPLYQ